MKIMLIIIMLSIVGCAEKKINNRWVGAVNELGIVAVYPPREDIYIGSIYLQVAKPECEKGYEKSGCDFSSVKIAQLNAKLVKELIDDSYQNTPEFRVQLTNCSSTIGNGNSAVAARGQASPSTSTVGCYSEGRVDNIGNSYSFKIIGFPDYNIERTKTASLGAILPNALMTKIGVSGSNIKNYSVSVPNAVYYSISMPLLIDKLTLVKSDRSGDIYFKNSNGDDKKITIPLEHGSLNNLEETAIHLCPKEDCYLTVIIPTEVYYSSVFNVSLISDSEFHLAGNASLDNPKGEKTQFKPALTDNQIATGDVISGSTDMGYGVASTVNYVSNNSISLKNKYDALLAVGYRGLAYRINPYKGAKSSPNPSKGLPTPGSLRELPNFNGNIKTN